MTEDLYIEYLKEYYQEHGTINDISPEKIVIYKNKQLQIGHFLSNMRLSHQKYLESQGKEMSTALMLTRYNKLSKMGFNWEKTQRKSPTKVLEEPAIRYLKEHYKKTGTINDIRSSDIVTFEGKELSIGLYLSKNRRLHAEYVKGSNNADCKIPVAMMRYSILSDLGIDWELSKKGKQTNPVRKEYRIDEDPYIMYLKQYYVEHGTINNIAHNSIVEFEGEALRIGPFLRRMIEHYNKKENHSEMERERFIALEELGIIWKKEKQPTIAETAKKNSLDKTSFKRLVRKVGRNRSKALQISLLEKKYIEDFNGIKENYSLKELFEDFNITFQELINLLNKDSLKTKENIGMFYFTDDMTLKDFCQQNNYNYQLISKAIRLSKMNLCSESLQSLITRVIIENQLNENTHIATWIYSKYGYPELLKSFFKDQKIDEEFILKTMSKEGISLELALEKELYKKYGSSKNKYLESITHNYISFYKKLESNSMYSKSIIERNLAGYYDYLKSEFELTESETNFISTVFDEYQRIMHQYKLFDVGFEKAQDTRIKKIINYRFSEDELEEAYFYPLNFKESSLIGSQKSLYTKRKAIKEYAKTWQTLTEEEKETRIISASLNKKEISYIESANQNLNELKAKVFQKK